ncbi:hypothetical protein LOTGIDRAFT_173470 [Lottia gigantea]|uniref:Uncharacterized protein n=1 Tax=Lottia gigantea TaxID=225164 RepID=V4CDA8_LOTGI|nr:hypothetical protein LOTGIDRAFT_173470 [Lottia gigantea]ESO99869.1 hypothetical protein LOTGIDRAFT_173470 [Lottia gigantea]
MDPEYSGMVVVLVGGLAVISSLNFDRFLKAPGHARFKDKETGIGVTYREAFGNLFRTIDSSSNIWMWMKLPSSCLSFRPTLKGLDDAGWLVTEEVDDEEDGVSVLSKVRDLRGDAEEDDEDDAAEEDGAIVRDLRGDDEEGAEEDGAIVRDL